MRKYLFEFLLLVLLGICLRICWIQNILCCVYFTTVKKLKRKRQAGICEIMDGENDWEGSWIVKGLAEELGFYFKNLTMGELCMRVT